VIHAQSGKVSCISSSSPSGSVSTNVKSIVPVTRPVYSSIKAPSEPRNFRFSAKVIMPLILSPLKRQAGALASCLQPEAPAIAVEIHSLLTMHAGKMVRFLEAKKSMQRQYRSSAGP